MKAYLIPGWGEDLKSRDYNAVLKVYKEAGYSPEFVNVHWNYKTIEYWIPEVKNKISKKKLENSLLSGFSFGAVISLMLAAEYASPQKLLLFSLSPYFAEDFPHLKPSWIKEIGKRNAEAFRKLKFEQLAETVRSATYIFAGLDETEEMKHRAEEASKIIKDCKLFMVGNAKHDVTDPPYLNAIKESLRSK